MANLRFAVLGAGFWAGFQIPAWFEVGGVELVALYNRTVSKAENLARKYNVPRVYGNPEALLRNEKLDFVDIITEVPAHEPLVLLAAKYRVPVICQKPMAPDYPTACRMVQACREAGIPFMVHENFRWQSTLRALKGILDEGTIGQPFRARLSFVFFDPAVFDNQPMLKQLPHLALTDVGSHVLDLARFYFGEPDTLYCTHSRTRGDIAGEDVATVMLKIGELTCTCEMSFSTRTEWGHFPETLAYIEGQRGTIAVGPDYWIRVTTEAGTLARRYPPPRYAWAEPMYDIVHASIVPCSADLLRGLVTGRPAETNGDDNLKTMRLVYSAYESAARNASSRSTSATPCEPAMNDPAAKLLRPLQDGDAPALLAFYNGLSPASIRTFCPLGTKTTLEACVEIVRGNDPIRRTRYDLVAARAGEIMGWTFLAQLDAPPPSLGLGIADASQGRGLGGALLDRLLAWARTQDVAGVCLIAVKDNARAIRLYESRGFATYGEFDNENDGLPYVRMAVELSAPPEPVEGWRFQTGARPAYISAP